MKIILTMTFLSVCGLSTAQDFRITHVELTANQVVLHYDLIDTGRNALYSVYLYSSQDNFLTPLAKVSGDAGPVVRPGANRRISWESRLELGEAFKGEIELEIRGRIYIPFIQLTNFDATKRWRRTVPYIIKWTGGRRQNLLNFQLYNGDKLVHDFPNAPMENEFTLVIPRKVRPSANYHLRISDSRNPDQVIFTPAFRVQRRIPLAIKSLPITGIIAALNFFPDSVDESLNPPPGTPANKN